MPEVIQQTYEIISVDVGSSPGTTSDDVPGIDFITADNALYSLANRGANALEIPSSGNKYSYEKYIKFGAPSVPSGYNLTNFKVWGSTDMIASGLTMYYKQTDTYVDPIRPVTASGFTRQDTNYYSAATALTISGTISSSGDYTNYLVAMVEVAPGAAINTVPTMTFNYSFDGPGQIFLGRFNGTIIDTITGDSGTFTEGLDFRDVKPGGSKIADGVMITDSDDLRFNSGSAINDAEHCDKGLTLNGTDQYCTSTASGLSPTGDFMITANIKRDDEGSEETIVGRWSENLDRCYRLYINSSDKLCFEISGDGTSIGTRSIVGATTITDDTWYSVAATFKGPSQADPQGKLNIFLDGLSDAPTVSGLIPAQIHQGETSWAQKQKLTASDQAVDDYFGTSVDMDGYYAIIGSIGDDSSTGSAYIFTMSGGVPWAQAQKLTASDAASGDLFGQSVKINGDYLIVGAYGDTSSAGSAYIFTRSGTDWNQTAKLVASDQGANDEFGVSVAIDGDYAVVGAFYNNSPDSNAGSVYVFTRSGTNWNQTAKLVASDQAVDDNLGLSVVINGDYIIIGSWHDDSPVSNAGSAYIYTRSGTNWSQATKIVASDQAVDDAFGGAATIYKNHVIVGARNNNSPASDAGAVYYFKRESTTFVGTKQGSTSMDTYFDGQIDNLRIFNLGTGGIYSAGYPGGAFEARIKNSVGLALYDETVPFSVASPGGVIADLHRTPYDSLTNLGYSTIEDLTASGETGHWLFNDDLTDETSNAFNLTGIGSSTYSTSYLAAPKQRTIMNTRLISFELWVKPENVWSQQLPADHHLFHSQDGSVLFRMRKRFNSQRIYYDHGVDNVNSGVLSATSGDYIHIVVVYSINPIINSTYIQFYLDGALVDYNTTKPLPLSVTPSIFGLGCTSAGGSQVDGVLHARIYDIAIPSTRENAKGKGLPEWMSVEGLYNSGSGVEGPLVNEHVVFDLVDNPN